MSMSAAQQELLRPTGIEDSDAKTAILNRYGKVLEFETKERVWLEVTEIQGPKEWRAR